MVWITQENLTFWGGSLVCLFFPGGRDPCPDPMAIGLRFAWDEVGTTAGATRWQWRHSTVERGLSQHLCVLGTSNSLVLYRADRSRLVHCIPDLH